MFIVADRKLWNDTSEFCYNVSIIKDAIKIGLHYAFTFQYCLCIELGKNTIEHPSFRKGGCVNEGRHIAYFLPGRLVIIKQKFIGEWFVHLFVFPLQYICEQIFSYIFLFKEILDLFRKDETEFRFTFLATFTTLDLKSVLIKEEKNCLLF